MSMTGMTDMHCHFLPAVDDGAGNIEETMGLLRMEYEQGVRQIILTPHYRAGLFETSRARIQEVYQEVLRQVHSAGLDVKLFLGCEFHRRAGMANYVRQETAYRMAGTQYVLVEFSGQDTMDTIKQHTMELLMAGFRPIIAHVERYPAVRKIEQIQYLADSGVMIQVNAGSIIGLEGWNSKRFCAKLLKEDLVHFVGSDAHNLRSRKPCMDRCSAYLEKKLGTVQARKILVDHPAALVMNEYI